MATSNFSVRNASKIYVVQAWEENGEVWTGRSDWNERIDDIVSCGDRLGWYKYDKSVGRDARGLLSKTFAFEYSTSNYMYEIEAIIRLNYGYYADANLDYQLMIDGDEYDLQDIVDVIADDFLKGCYCGALSYEADRARKSWNKGLRFANEKRFRKTLAKFIDEIVEECEKFCKDNCNSTYVQIGRASNGEGFYEKVS